MTKFMAPDDVATLRDICGPPERHPCYCEEVQALCDSHELWRGAAAMNHGDLLNELTTLVDEVHRLRDLCKSEGINP
jgi:hypothetical protein